MALGALIGLNLAAGYPGAVAGRSPGRQHALDHLRTFLTGLVIAHHTAAAYGGSGSLPLKSSVFSGRSLPLLFFNAVNQSFFMGLFFWISGRMSALALRRSSRANFIRSKMVRLGIPTLVYTLLLEPIGLFIGAPVWDKQSLLQCSVGYWARLRDIHGPVWYTATLLLFDSLAAMLYQPQAKTADDDDAKPAQKLVLSNKLLIGGSLGVAIISYGVRVWFPVGTALRIISVQPAFLPQYIFAYGLGYLSVGREPRITDTKQDTQPETIPSNRKTQLTLPLAILLSVVTFPLIVLPQLYHDSSNWINGTLEQSLGGRNTSALLYAVWNEFSFLAISSSLIHYFQQYHNEPAKSLLWRSRYSYAAFLVHTPVNAAVERATEALLVAAMGAWPLFGKFAESLLCRIVTTTIVSGVNIFASFSIGRWLIQTFPALGSII